MMTPESATSARFEDSIVIPVEDMGTGIFNILGDMIGGIVNLHRFATTKTNEGLAILKEKFGKEEESAEEEMESLPIDPVLRSAPHHGHHQNTVKIATIDETEEDKG
ncbi:MAG: hypothetical protein HW380_1028 [Magnetococcales bacterium]|nr:hypothetical protein [Magnetococcales bacterium]HIJ85726.1 hypothetical protein [Magnetococcales bacterium]